LIRYEIATDKIQDENEKVKDSVSTIGDTFDETGERISESLDDNAQQLSRNKELAKILGDEWTVVGDNVVKVGEQSQLSMGAAAKASGELFLVMEDGSVVTGNAAKAFTDFNDVTKEVVKLDKEAEKALTDRVESLAKFKLGIEAIQSAERVSIFEFKTELDLADIEASTEKFRALTDTIQTGLTSTAGTIVELFKLLAGGTTRESSFIREAIERQLDLQERQVALQEELTRARIAEIEAQRLARERGDALIKISVDPNTEYHLGEVLRSLVEYAQIEAVLSKDEFLLNT
jgi:hypothetical protein